MTWIIPAAATTHDGDTDVVARVLAGDTEAFRIPVERYEIPVVNGTSLEYSTVPAGTASVLEERSADTQYRIALASDVGPRSPSTLAAVKVPGGHCFLLGDNRRQSVDSRSLGPVPLTDIVGRVWRPW